MDKGMYVEGKYRIIRKIGQGGMSCVYLAVEDISKMKVAVKEVKKNNSGNPELFKCLYAEIHTLRKLTHPNLLRFLMLWSQTIDFLLSWIILKEKP